MPGCRHCRTSIPRRSAWWSSGKGAGRRTWICSIPKPVMRDGGEGHSRARPRDDAALDDVERLRQVADAAGDQAVQEVRPVGHRAERDAAERRRRWPTRSAWSAACTPRRSTTPPGVTFFMTGAQVPGRPSMGAWLSYGLGSETDNLPTFVVMTSSDKGKTCGQLFFDYYWGSGFLPSRFQGVRFRNTGDLVPYLANPPGVSREARRALLDDIGRDERRASGRLRRSRDRHAHRPVRDGVPHADERARPRRLLERIEDTHRPVRPRRPGQGHVRQQLPDRPPAARARRAVRAVDAFRLGSARQSVHAARGAVQGHGRARRRRWCQT